MAAPISRAAVGQKFWKCWIGRWSTDGARHRSSRGRAKASGILGRPLRHRGRGLRSTEVEHFCGEVRADGWPTSVASSEVCFLLCAACFKWPCGRFRRQAVSRQWFFFPIEPWWVFLPASSLQAFVCLFDTALTRQGAEESRYGQARPLGVRPASSVRGRFATGRT